MKRLQSILKTFFLAICSGICIGMGGAVYLTLENKTVGAFMFTVGLFTILIFGFKLYTGMVGYVSDSLLEKNFGYLGTVVCVWLGNFAGTALTAGAFHLTRLKPTLQAAARKSLEAKLEDSWYSLLLLGVFCGILMFIAVDTYKKKFHSHPLLACIAVVLGVVVFILAGFEHSIADMFYAVMAGQSKEMLIPILIITLGNAIGGNLIPLVLRMTKDE